MLQGVDDLRAQLLSATDRTTTGDAHVRSLLRGLSAEELTALALDARHLSDLAWRAQEAALAPTVAVTESAGE